MYTFNSKCFIEELYPLTSTKIKNLTKTRPILENPLILEIVSVERCVAIKEDTASLAILHFTISLSFVLVDIIPSAGLIVASLVKIKVPLIPRAESVLSSLPIICRGFLRFGC